MFLQKLGLPQRWSAKVSTSCRGSASFKHWIRATTALLLSWAGVSIYLSSACRWHLLKSCLSFSKWRDNWTQINTCNLSLKYVSWTIFFWTFSDKQLSLLILVNIERKKRSPSVSGIEIRKQVPWHALKQRWTVWRRTASRAATSERSRRERNPDARETTYNTSRLFPSVPRISRPSLIQTDRPMILSRRFLLWDASNV